MDKLLKSHWFVRITAFLVALMMYTSVNITNQDATDTEEDVRNGEGPIYKTVSVEAEYDESKYELMGLPKTAAVEFQGSRADLTKLNLQRGQTAFVDLSDKGPGQYEATLKMSNIPNGVEYAFEEPTVSVTLHEKKTETFPVTIQLLDVDELPEGYIAGTPEADQKEIEITGAKEIIDEIKYVRAFVNVGTAKETFTREVKIQALNKSYDPIDIKIDPATTEVTVPIDNPNKDVDLSVESKGSLPDGVELKSITPENKDVTIHAPKELLDRLDSIKIPVDLSNITEDKTIEVSVPLPDGAFYASPGKVKVKIDVEKVEESSSDSTNETASSRTFEDVPINIRGLSDNQEAAIRTPEKGVMDLTVQGDEEALKDLSEESITAFIDAQNLSEGEHDVEINVELPEAFTYQNEIKKATLTISETTA
ncbi:CdaR family protein [Pseudalkalibacillus berkeleyi]|uniref:YbbR domain-containing protein n=1 Tax=Pseudalkalibacillus berkeleyi TaxID=1069813 RepID=A0ABS9H628_9BACL|nr:CdaR family protein [Pseudalkalibacillus berkeleyi]MCF6139425.1 hypothetical protein [Pseudalkalibacillus berkeleyi]